jgi:putative endonuclease
MVMQIQEHSTPMFYTYILRSSKSKFFYYGHTQKNPDIRTKEHNSGIMKSTKPHIPWKLVWYCAFETLNQAKDFEVYLKSGSGKAFAYKRLVNVALKKDLSTGRN